VPGTGVPSAVLTTIKLLPETVTGLMSSLKVTLIWVLFTTLAAPDAGRVSVTVGAVVSRVTEVVKLQVSSASRPRPVLSCAAVVTRATQTTPGGSAAIGVSVATRVDAS